MLLKNAREFIFNNFSKAISFTLSLIVVFTLFNTPSFAAKTSMSGDYAKDTISVVQTLQKAVDTPKVLKMQQDPNPSTKSDQLSYPEPDPLLDNAVIGGDATRYFLETETETPVECTVTSAISGAGLITVVLTSSVGQATPEPASSLLPVWLLYQATQ